RPSQATILVDLAKDAPLFHDAEGTGYATIPINGHSEHHKIRSRPFKDWLTRLFYTVEGKVPGNQGLQDAINLIDGRSRFDGPEQQVFLRVAENDTKLYLDLCDKQWRAVEIDATGWRIVNKPPVVFIRKTGMLPLPDPVPTGNLSALWDFINIRSADERLLTSAWLLAALRPRGPYPALCVQGEQGSAKSTTARLLRSLIDPHTVMLRTTPRDERDLVISAANSHIVAFDNLSGVQNWLSDALCRLATGGGFATRQLYTDADELLIDVVRPAVLNGIDDIAGRGDLIDRAIILNLASIPEEERQTEVELWQRFEKVRPSILGALLSAASAALANISSVHLEKLPRMADFAVWATAGELALGAESPGDFMNAYKAARETAVEDGLEGNLMYVALQALGDSRRGEHWEGKPTELHTVLTGYLNDDQLEYFPSARTLRNHIKRLAPGLRQTGLVVKADARKNGVRTISLDWVRKTSALSALNSQEPVNHAGSVSADVGKIIGTEYRDIGTKYQNIGTDSADSADVVPIKKTTSALNKPVNHAGSSGFSADSADKKPTQSSEVTEADLIEKYGAVYDGIPTRQILELA
ncbi:MAG: hypothetical protein KDJ99_14580, partial [Candidatus Competibacteraceae bacterium]|nr:hypothetical protein [Candidatus Competibacteraceae bacterium]